MDAISCMAKNPSQLKGMFSGSMDGGTLIFPILSYECDFMCNCIGKMSETLYY